ncbi:copper resistance D family protein [Streptomyces diastatochromogenes]|uniref:copper resistance D family protein n=1 Tax=Streptomyces diastatochromogenes TaxID=42236 RepID=UPI0036BE7606
MVYSAPPLWRTLTQLGYFIGLSAAIGATVTYAGVVRPALRIPGNEGGDVAALRRRTATLLAWAGVLLVVTAYFQLAARVAKSVEGMPFREALEPGRMWAFLRAPALPGSWVSQGTLLLMQNLVVGLASALLIALFSPRGRRRLDGLARTALPLAVAVPLIPSVPTSGFENTDYLLGSVLVVIHIVSGGVWLGGLTLLVALAGTRRSLSDRAGLLWADVWRRFSLVALICVGAVLISGLWQTWKHVGSVPQLWTTPYGLFLLVKIILVLGVITGGGVNQFWLMPRIALARQADAHSSLAHLTLRHFPKVVWIEVALGVGVLAVVPFLLSAGSARPDAAQPVATADIITAGVALVLTLAASLYATTKTSEALCRRQVAAHATTATARPREGSKPS